MEWTPGINPGVTTLDLGGGTSTPPDGVETPSGGGKMSP